MRRNRVVLFLLLFAALEVQAQSRDSGRIFSLTAGMGVDAHSAPSVSDYVNLVAQPGREERFDEFSSAMEFFIEPEIQILENWSVGLEYSVMIKSHRVSQSAGIGDSEFSYTVQLPAILANYIVPGEGYLLKFGAGIGYARGDFSQRLFGSAQSSDFQSKGLTAKLEAVGNTRFDENFYGSIGADLRWIAGGVFKSQSGVEARVGGTKAEMSFFNIGLKFGVMILF